MGTRYMYTKDCLVGLFSNMLDLPRRWRGYHYVFCLFMFQQLLISLANFPLIWFGGRLTSNTSPYYIIWKKGFSPEPATRKARRSCSWIIPTGVNKARRPSGAYARRLPWLVLYNFFLDFTRRWLRPSHYIPFFIIFTHYYSDFSNFLIIVNKHWQSAIIDLAVKFAFDLVWRSIHK